MNGSISCPKCNREIGGNNKFCPYCGGKLNVSPSFVPQCQNNNVQQFSSNNILNGRYRIENVIEKCDLYTTYLADDITLQMKVVINEFHSKDLIQEEARNRAKFSGLPGIAEMRDYFEQGESAYTVMEWLNGGSLQNFIDRNGYGNPNDVQSGMGKKLSMDMTKQMMEPIISGLIKIHEAGSLHGDICPDNMAFSNKGMLKLLHPFHQTNTEENSDKTVMLNMGYAPIETYHISGSKGPWSDVYSLCATMYKCVTGIQPVEAGERAYQDTLKRPSELGVQINPYDEAALMTGLSVNADKRFVDMKVLYKALYRTVQSQSQTPPQTPPSQVATNTQKKNTAEPKKKNTGLIVGIIASAVLLVGVVIAGIFILPNLLSSDKQKETASKNEEEIKQDTKSELSDKDLLRIELIDEQAAADDSYTNQKEVLEQYYTFASEYNAVDEISEQVEECFEKYQSGILEHVDMLAALDVYPAMYIQIKLELDSVLELAERFEKAGIEVNCENSESKDSTLQVDYKQNLITNFDDKAFESINSNGVISRSVLWSAMENADQTGLFNNSDADDPLRLRYAAALAFHIDSQLTGTDAAADIAKIYDSLEATDYSPLLLYYLSYNYGDDKAKDWYKEVNAILASTIGDFDSMTINEKRNTIFYLSANDGDYATARSQIREYMQNNFKKP